MSRIIVTGGMGYIGSHTTIELLNVGFDVLILDNLANSEIITLERIKKITGKNPDFEQIDVRDLVKLNSIIKKYQDITGIIHFAAYKAVGESVEKPLEYYDNNLNSLISVLKSMVENKINNLVFSSSCTVYGQPDVLPVTESSPLKKAESPYGNTKQICEDIIRDFQNSGSSIKVISLRYFNPVGAHESGLIGELPRGIPNNLMPYITQTALGIRECLSVFGNDYNTIDGTAVRDYIHVSDLAEAHLKALDYLEHQNSGFYDVFNVGTGVGYTVLQVIESINKTLEKTLPYKIVGRRSGDIEKIWADSTKSNNILKWHPKFELDDMTRTAYNWEKNYRK